MTPVQQKFLDTMKKHLDEMSDEEFKKAVDECTRKYPTGPTIAEFCKWNNIPYGDNDV